MVAYYRVTMPNFEVTSHPVKPFRHCQRAPVIQKKGQRVAFCPVGGGQTDRERERDGKTHLDMKERKGFNLGVGQKR